MSKFNFDFFSFNVRGLGQKVKRNMIFSNLKKKSKNGIFLLQETHCTKHMEKKWKDEWGGEILFSNLTSESGGVMIMFSPGLDITFSEIESNDPGRSLLIDINIAETENLILCNLYAPTRNKVHDQLSFLSKLKSKIESLDFTHLMLGGDFNTIFDPDLDKLGGNTQNSINEYTNELTSFMEAYDLMDAVRLIYQDRTIFTRVQRKPLVLTRIDHWLISSQMCNFIKSCEVLPGIKSDHSIVQLILSNTNSKRGRGFWKFNSQLLHDKQYVDNINTLITKAEKDTATMEDKGLRWDCIKCEIRTNTLSYSINKTKEKKQLQHNLESEIKLLQDKLVEDPNEDNLQKYEKIQKDIENIELESTKGAILRSKVQWAEHGEKNSKYFLNLEKQNAINKTIVRLQGENGEIVENQNGILSEAKLFYENLYTENTKNVEESTAKQFFIENHPSLSTEDKQHCEGLISLDECSKAIKDMQNGKSPGTDGLTVDFYKFFWCKIKYIVLDSINYAYIKGELSVDQRRGIITLIPKKDKPRIFLKNWRPISLLNTDYKIITKALAGRLQKVLPSIINFDQTGFLKGRYIGENIRTISDIIEYAKLRNIPGIILLIDFEKAFDTIRWSHILKCLDYFNFGESFINWIKAIYSNINSVVINNGHASEPFQISRGIRQGCPISPYLFIVSVEVLAISIRTNKKIKGIQVGPIEIKISQLADDTTLFMSNLASVKHALSCLSDFHKVSGLRVNISKTVGMGIGTLTDVLPDDKYGIEWTKGPITTLGITITNDPKLNVNFNFEPRLKTMTSTLNIWLSRNLSINGKVAILKSVALPKLQYVASNIPITSETYKKAENIISKFIWNHKRPKVNKNVTIQSIEDGGIKAPDFRSIVKANRVSWVKRLGQSNESKWKAILTDLIKPISIEHFIETNLSEDDIAAIPIPFYREVFAAWNEIKLMPSQVIHYRSEILWHNKFIKTPVGPKSKKNETVICAKLYRVGITRINDLINVNGDPMTYDEFNHNYHINFNVLSYYKLIKSIPIEWLQEIKTFNKHGYKAPNIHHTYKIDNGSHSDLYLDNATTKQIYNAFVKKKIDTPSCLRKWENEFMINFGDEWKVIFRLPYSCTRSTQLQALQYRILHRYLPCRKWLHTISIVDNNMCENCNVIDTIEHYIFSCNLVKNMWSQIETWWNSISDCKIVLTKKHVILGFYYDLKHFSGINYIILLAKMYIYSQKMNKKDVSFNTFLLIVKNQLMIEKIICEHNNTIVSYNKKWKNIIEWFN